MTLDHERRTELVSRVLTPPACSPAALSLRNGLTWLSALGGFGGLSKIRKGVSLASLSHFPYHTELLGDISLPGTDIVSTEQEDA